ncbi:UDP-galactopyranose mutase, partial [Faunimonas pinastri]
MDQKVSVAKDLLALASDGENLSCRADVLTPLLVCLSHLRWDFVYQRPQHLLVRAARGFSVVFMEEPVFADEPAPRLDV